MVSFSTSPLSQAATSPDPTRTDDSWLQSFPLHPILHFDSKTQSHSNKSTSTKSKGLTSQLISIRSSDLILATHNQLRTCSLVEAKHAADHANLPSYKILNHPSLNFQIESILTNPNGSLLAVVGTHQILVVVLPRSTSLPSSGLDPTSFHSDSKAQSIDVRAVPVGSYYHNSRAGNAGLISKVMWHPWGTGGNSLLVLTRDGYLREYDVSEDSEEPLQTLSLLPSTPPPNQSSKTKSKSSSSKRQRSRPRSRSRSRSVSLFHHHHDRSSVTPSAGGSRIGLEGSNFNQDGLNDEDDLENQAASFTLGLDIKSFSTDESIGGNGNGENSSLDIDEKEGRNGDLPQSDWSPLTIYAVARNGDTYSVCPFLPAHASIPPSYIHYLSYYVSSSTLSSISDPTLSRQTDLSSRFVNILQRQAKEKIEEIKYSSSGKKGRDTALTPKLRDFGLSSSNEKGKGKEQSRNLRSPSSMRYSGTPMSLDAFTPSRDLNPTHQDESEDLDDDLISFSRPIPIVNPSIFAPTLFDSPPEIQGPFLLSPAPEELDEAREAIATDLLFSRITASTGLNGSGKDKDLEVLVISNDDGRLDLCVNLSKVEAKWSKRTKDQGNDRRRPGRYGLSDTSDESDLEDEPGNRSGAFLNPSAESLPSLFVYETLDLGLSASLASSSTLDEDGTLKDEIFSINVPTLVLDPLYSDTIYVYHSLGVHAISINKWSTQLCKAISSAQQSGFGQDFNSEESSSQDEGLDSSQLTRFLHSQIPSEVVWVVKTFSPSVIAEALSNPNSSRSSLIPTSISGMTLLSDVYLGYTLLAITDDSQLVASELGLRVSDLDLDEEFVLDNGPQKLDSDLNPKGYISLLGSEPFIPPSPFSSTSNNLPTNPRFTNPNIPGGQTELKVTPQTLRFLAERANQFRTEMREVVKAGNSVQSRLNLQVKEVQRQLEKLNDIKKRSSLVVTGGGMNSSRTSRKEETLEMRLKRVERKQLELIKRTDSTLQKLMDSNQPIISQSERKWFDELDNLSREVGVSSSKGGDEKKGFKLLEEKLEYQLSQLRPSMQELAAKQQVQQTETRRQALGASQLQKIERLLGEESRLLIEAKNKVGILNTRISRDLGRIGA